MKNPTFYFSALLVFSVCMGTTETARAQTYIRAIEDATGADFVQQSIVSVGHSDEFVVVGTVTPGPVSGGSDILMLWLDISGIISWSRYIDYGNDEFAGSLLLDLSKQHIVLTGYTGTNGGSFANKNLIVTKFDYQGNLVNDIIVQDIEPGYGFSLYGMDIEQTDNGDYIVMGTGAAGAFASSAKYGFVLRVDQNLSSLQWGYRYESVGNGTNTRYDSFNDILRIENQPQGDVFLLTGSGMDPVNNGQMVVNDLIDLNGSSIWGGARGHKMSAYNNPGVRALFNKTTNKFYVLYFDVENIPGILVLDGTGHFLASHILHNHQYPTTNDNNNFITGMTWGNPQQTEMVLSGY